MRTCTSVAPASCSIETSCRIVFPRTMESSTITTRLPATSVERVVLDADALLAHALLRLDEGAADVAVLDQTLVEGNAARAREADRRRRARVGDRHHQVGLDGSLAGEPLAHPHPRAVDLDPVDRRVRPGEVEELEDAELPGPLGWTAWLRMDAVLVDHDELAGSDLALELRADEIERAALGRDDRVAVD